MIRFRRDVLVTTRSDYGIFVKARDPLGPGGAPAGQASKGGSIPVDMGADGTVCDQRDGGQLAQEEEHSCVSR